MACNSFIKEITAQIRERGVALPIEGEHVQAWLTDFGDDVAHEANALGLTPRDLACTFVAAVVAPTWSAYCQVGDGGIVVGIPDRRDQEGTEFEVVFWPEQGEYANETYFATTPGALEHLQFRTDDRPVRELALFSDGLQRMVLKFDTREAFAPFFHRMLQTVRRVNDGAGELPELSRGLAAYLGSAVVSERTDDDVSLVLATRSHELAEPSQVAQAPSAAEPEPVAETHVDGIPATVELIG